MLDMIQGVCSFSPCECRTVELLDVSKDKWAFRLIRKRVGMHTWVKGRQEELSSILACAKGSCQEGLSVLVPPLQQTSLGPQKKKKRKEVKTK